MLFELLQSALESPLGLEQLHHQGCPAHVQISEQVKSRLEQLPGIRTASVNIVWTPPWTPERLSADARKQLGIE